MATLHRRRRREGGGEGQAAVGGPEAQRHCGCCAAAVKSPMVCIRGVAAALGGARIAALLQCPVSTWYVQHAISMLMSLYNTTTPNVIVIHIVGHEATIE